MSILVVAHNIRSIYNIGALLRTCDGFGVNQFWATGYTPYPELADDERPPHVRQKITAQIHKTALGAENSVSVHHATSILLLIERLRASGCSIVGLEQHPRAIPLPSYQPPAKLALILGEEVQGIPSNVLSACDQIIEIPMRGQKESFNVSVAAGIALYGLTLGR